MRKRIIALVLVLCMTVSFISFAQIPGTDEAIPEVYAYDFYFKDAGSNVLKTNAAGDILAEAYAYLTDKSISELDVTLSIFVYYKNKVIAAESITETITKTAKKITTPYVTVDSAVKDDVTVKAYLTAKDFSALFAPSAVLGSSDANVEKITVGEYEIFPEEEVYEYNITRFFKAEEITPPLRAYTTDLSAVKEISSTEDNGVIKYTLKTVSCDTQNEKEYKINLTPIIAEDTSLASIEIDGKTIKDFSSDKKEYTIAVTDGQVPEVTPYKFNSDAKVDVADATKVPGTTTVKVSFGSQESTYKINFVKPETTTLNADTGNPSYQYAYQYRDSATKVSAGLVASLLLKTGDANYKATADRVGYAAFDINSLGNVDIIYPINIKTTQRYTYYALIEVYNSTFEDSVNIKDEFAEIREKKAKLIGSFMATTANNTIAVNEGDVKICDNGNIVLAFTKKFGGHPQESASGVINLTSAVLEVTYLPKNLSELTDNSFDTTLTDKPQKPDVIKGNASVAASSEWSDLNGFTLLKINLDATFPSGCENKNVLVKVLKPGINESDNKALSEKYAYIYETKTNDDGEINESFNLSCDAGAYTFVLSLNGYEKSVSTTLTMPSADKMNELLEGLKGGTYNKDTLSAFLTTNKEGLSLSDSIFASFSDTTKKEVSQYVIDNIENITAGGFSEALNKGSILLGINTNETNETILKILDSDEIKELLKANENYADFENSSEDELIPLLKTGSFNTYNSIADAVYENLFIINLKKCVESDDITKVIACYRNYMTPECYLKYKGISEDDKEIINVKILEKLTEIDTISKLEEIILSNLPDKITIIEPSRTIHTYGFNFKNQSNNSIKKIGTSSKIKAEVYAELSNPSDTNINAKFVIMAYNGDKLLYSDAVPCKVTKDASLISAGFINIDADVTDVKAVLMSEDEKEMMSAIGTLGSSQAKIEDIYVGNYKLPLKEGQTEYNLTRFFDENEAVKLRAYAKDFATNIKISEEKTDGIISYTVKSTSSDGNNDNEYKINLKPYIVNSASIAGIELSGKEIEGFSPDVKEYYIGMKGSIVPEVTVYKFNNKAQVTVSNATSIPGTTVIKVVNGDKEETYKINFVKIHSTNIRHSEFCTMSGNHTYDTTYQVRASTEPLDGGTNIVLYYLFDLNSLGNIAISNAWISGTTITENKLYFYNSTYSEIAEVRAPSALNFKEINDGLVKYLGERKFAKGENASVPLDKSNLEIKDNGKVMILTRKKAGDINSTDYGQFQNGELKLEYIVKPSNDVKISEISDKGFDVELLDKGELTYLSTKDATLSLDTKWSGDTPKVELSVDAVFTKESANQNVFVKILKPGIKETDNKPFGEKYVYMNTLALDENGNAKTTVAIDGITGDYKIILKCENSDKALEGTFKVPQSDKITTLINNLKNGLFTKDTLYTYLLTNKEDLSLDNSLLSLITETSGKSVCDYIINNMSVYTADGFSDVLSEALVVKGINNHESNANVEKLLEEDSIYSSLKSDKNYKDYTSLTDKTVFLNKLKAQTFTSLDDVKEAFFENLLIVKLSGIKSYLSVEGLINSYSDYIDSSVYNKYNSLTFDERTAVETKIAENIRLITDISVLETKIGEFIDNPNAIPPVIIPPAASQGGGGGGGLGNVTTKAPDIIPPVSMNFTDVPKDFWGYSYIENLYNKKIISGKSETEFCPYDNVTRAEFTKMLVVALGMTGNTAIEFEDVSSDSWYYDYVNIGVANGVIQGMSKASFAPDRSISRQDASVMINRLLKLENSSQEVFADDESIADYAKDAIYALKENNIINGYENNFNPLNNLTRAEAAVLISNIIK